MHSSNRAVNSKLQGIPHRRYNPLTKEWIFVSPQKQGRQWEEINKPTQIPRVSHDPFCALCPGNSLNDKPPIPRYSGPRVFEGNSLVLMPNVPDLEEEQARVIYAKSEPGICKIVSLSPQHDLTLPQMLLGQIETLLKAIIDQFEALSELPWIRSIQIFDSSFSACESNRVHPHWQIWGTASAPNVVMKESRSLYDYYETEKSCLLCDYLSVELHRAQRVVYESESFAVIVPYWAAWPLETLLLSKRHVSTVSQLDEHEMVFLAQALNYIARIYDNIGETRHPYSMVFHQAQNGGRRQPEWHLHLHSFHPLLSQARSPDVLLSEAVGMSHRAFTPEQAAAWLRQAGELQAIH